MELVAGSVGVDITPVAGVTLVAGAGQPLVTVTGLDPVLKLLKFTKLLKMFLMIKTGGRTTTNNNCNHNQRP